MLWNLWWVWIAAGLVLALLELLLPSFIFLGFAIGAILTGLLLALGGPLADWLAASPAATLAVFATLSLIAWLAIRHFVGRRNRTRPQETDINNY